MIQHFKIIFLFNILFFTSNTLCAQNPSPIMQYDGTLVPSINIELTSPYHSVLKQKHVDYGDHVAKGQLLYELSSPELQAKLTLARIELIEATQQVKKLKNWLTGHEMLQAQSNVNRALHDHQHSSDRFEQTKKLYHAGIVSKEEYLSDHRSNEESLQRYQNAQLCYEEVKRKGNKEMLQLAQLKLSQSAMYLESLEKKQKNLTVRSPISGIIYPPLRQKNQEGYGVTHQSVFTEGQTIAIVASIEALSVKIKVDEFDIIHLKKNQTADLVFMAFPNNKLKGKIHEINTQLDQAKESHHAANFEVKLLLDDIPDDMKEKLLLGMSATVKFDGAHA